MEGIYQKIALITKLRHMGHLCLVVMFALGIVVFAVGCKQQPQNIVATSITIVDNEGYPRIVIKGGAEPEISMLSITGKVRMSAKMPAIIAQMDGVALEFFDYADRLAMTLNNVDAPNINLMDGTGRSCISLIGTEDGPFIVLQNRKTGLETKIRSSTTGFRISKKDPKTGKVQWFPFPQNDSLAKSK